MPEIGFQKESAMEIPVPSRSKPDEIHTVTIFEGLMTCTCQGYRYRRNCFHIKSVQSELPSEESNPII